MIIRLVLADDHTILRRGIRSLLEKEEDIDVVGEAEDGRQAVELACLLKPDILVMDISMPNLSGVEATRQVVKVCPACKVIGLSMHSSRKFVLEMLRAGASGFLLKDCAHEELVVAIRSVAGKQVYLSPAIADIVTHASIFGGLDGPDMPGHSLTPRERETLQLVAEGRTTKQMARQMGVSVKSVETYRHNLMEKLDLHSIAELTKYAIREGLATLDE